MEHHAEEGFKLDPSMMDLSFLGEAKSPMLGLGPLSPSVSEEADVDSDVFGSAFGGVKNADYHGAFGADAGEPTVSPPDSERDGGFVLPAQVYHHEWTAPPSLLQQASPLASSPLGRSTSDGPIGRSSSDDPDVIVLRRQELQRAAMAASAGERARSVGRMRPVRSSSDHGLGTMQTLSESLASVRTAPRAVRGRPIVRSLSADEYSTPLRSAITPPPARQRRNSFSSRKDRAPPRAGFCTCCGSTQTPLWREGRGGARLCNACGIRWVKYGISCSKCNYVPRKTEAEEMTCPKCETPFPRPEAPGARRRSSSSASAHPPEPEPMATEATAAPGVAMRVNRSLSDGSGPLTPMPSHESSDAGGGPTPLGSDDGAAGAPMV